MLFYEMTMNSSILYLEDVLSYILRKSGFPEHLTFILVSTWHYLSYKRIGGSMKLKQPEILSHMVDRQETIMSVYNLEFVKNTEFMYLYLTELAITKSNIYWIEVFCEKLAKLGPISEQSISHQPIRVGSES